MASEAMFATISPFLVIYDNTTKASINLLELTDWQAICAAVDLASCEVPEELPSPAND
jgi:hypothetical protein